MKAIPAVPWLTESAIWFLENYLRANMRVLEFGMGASTIWMASRCNLISVEHDPQWFAACRDEISGESQWEGHLLPRPYHTFCANVQEKTVDLVLIDGRDRMLCLTAALPLIKPCGYLMLDNAERGRYVRVYQELLRHWDETRTIQRQPDRLGRGHDGRVTAWWQKPKSEDAFHEDH